MSWLHSVDVALFRFINLKLSHPVLDWIMPLFAGNPVFVPAVLLLAVALLWKGGIRGRIFVILLLVVIGLGDAFVINTLKDALGRMRPFHDITDAHLLVGKGSSGSMPSSHTSTWFAAMVISYFFYPRSWRFMLPMSLIMGFSRVYVGVHYPSDVLIGAILGCGYAAAGVLALNAVWIFTGRRWFPEWWRRLPSLLALPQRGAETAPTLAGVTPALHGPWLRLGYILVAILTVVRLAYIGSDTIELSEDEAYQWLWSKHLALSYYSKPPMIALLQFAGTSLWGDSEFGVRFLSPLIAAILSVMLLRFISKTVNERAAFWLVVIINCTPLLAVGATLMTIDPPLVLFWTAAMVSGWRAMQPDSPTSSWLWVGLWMGLGFLSKYSALFQIVCWVIFFALYVPARVQLRRPGPWLALLITALCTLPVLIWNAQHGWVTVEHVAYNAGRTSPWKPTLNFFGEFLGAQCGLLNPVFLVGALWAMAAFWRRWRHDPLLLFFFSMGAPVFLGYTAFTLYKRVFPNWIAPAVLPMFCLMVVYWVRRWPERASAIKGWLATALAIGTTAVIVLHDTNLTKKIMDRYLPPPLDPLRRVRAWTETAKVVTRAREDLLSRGKPVFIIADHYGLAGELSFYLPSPRPPVYYKTSLQPRNQFYFWPGYRGNRLGENAIFVNEVSLPKLQRDWFGKWIAGERDLLEKTPPHHSRAPAQLLEEFEAVREIGIFDVRYKGRFFRRLQLFECKNLKL